MQESTPKSSIATTPAATCPQPKHYTATDSAREHGTETSAIRSHDASQSALSGEGDASREVVEPAPAPEDRKRPASFIDVVPANDTTIDTKKKGSAYHFDMGLFNSPTALRDLMDDVNAAYKEKK